MYLTHLCDTLYELNSTFMVVFVCFLLQSDYVKLCLYPFSCTLFDQRLLVKTLAISSLN